MFGRERRYEDIGYQHSAEFLLETSLLVLREKSLVLGSNMKQKRNFLTGMIKFL